MSDPAPSILRIRSEHDEGVHTLVLAGELDYGVVSQLEAAYAEVYASETGPIGLDLSGLEFADSSAVRLLVDLAAKSRSNGRRLTLTRGSARVQRIFELTGTAEQLPFVR